MTVIEDVKQYVEGEGKRRSRESMSGFLNFSSGLWALSDLHTIPASQ